jgi:hypothetical protein
MSDLSRQNPTGRFSGLSLSNTALRDAKPFGERAPSFGVNVARCRSRRPIYQSTISNRKNFFDASVATA